MLFLTSRHVLHNSKIILVLADVKIILADGKIILAGGKIILAGGEIQEKKNLIRRFTITAKGRLNPSMTNDYLALIPSNLSFLLLAKSKLEVNGTKRGGEDGGVGKEWEIE